VADLVDKDGKPFNPMEEGTLSPLHAEALMRALTKPLWLNDPVRRLRETVAEITGKPQNTTTVKWRKWPSP
jgi:hypothetical protein